jgi:hypothetical protein
MSPGFISRQLYIGLGGCRFAAHRSFCPESNGYSAQSHERVRRERFPYGIIIRIIAVISGEEFELRVPVTVVNKQLK